MEWRPTRAQYKQIVRERNALKLQIQAAPARFVRVGSAIRAPPQFFTLFNEVAAEGDFAVRVFGRLQKIHL